MIQLPKGTSSRTHSAERSEKVLARRLEHVVRVGDPEVEDHQHQRSQRPEKDPPPAKPPPRISSPRAELPRAKQRPCGWLEVPWWLARPLMSVSDRHGDSRSENTRGDGPDWHLGDEDLLRLRRSRDPAWQPPRDDEANRDRTGDSSYGRNQQTASRDLLSPAGGLLVSNDERPATRGYERRSHRAESSASSPTRQSQSDWRSSRESATRGDMTSRVFAGACEDRRWRLLCASRRCEASHRVTGRSSRLRASLGRAIVCHGRFQPETIQMSRGCRATVRAAAGGCGRGDRVDGVNRREGLFRPRRRRGGGGAAW